MLKQILNFGGAKSLDKSSQKNIKGGGGFIRNCTPQACADEYNETAFEALPASAFKCVNGVCQFV